MNNNSIEYTQEYYIKDYNEWASLIDKSLKVCIDETNTSVISQLIQFNKNKTAGPLSGVPYAVKDLFDIKGFPSKNSSILPEFEACSTKDSAIITRMNQLGASCVAKTQMNEFAYGLTGENLHFGNCRHPLLENCLSGGSSSGSAYLVASGYLPLSFGTDTGGSIRLPAAWCGVYGIRWVPGYFLEGAFPLAPSFDTMGWFSASAEDMTHTLQAWFNHGSVISNHELNGLSILPKQLLEIESFNRLSEVLSCLEIKQLTSKDDFEGLLPNCLSAFNVLQSIEAYAIHEKFIDKRSEAYDPKVMNRILRARKWTEEDISKANLYKTEITNWFNDFFKTHDFLVMPICPTASVPLKDANSSLRELTLQLTTPASLSGLPALSVPVWLDEKRSIGLQFIFKKVEPTIPLAIVELCKNI